ncbi:hypothetical protein NDU88_001409 [Pleurodeles waltl]|uniref:Uncharacterized protein n=1 Tax=Pleurodeles waltl TaxID=8319 RepID=A0AAV7VBQ7_PLEWA|nr:hypothetical protein NDU88_001409 [Pleurodeles waltl]
MAGGAQAHSVGLLVVAYVAVIWLISKPPHPHLCLANDKRTHCFWLLVVMKNMEKKFCTGTAPVGLPGFCLREQGSNYIMQYSTSVLQNQKTTPFAQRRRERSDPECQTAPRWEPPDAPGWGVGRDRTPLSRISRGRGERGGRCFPPSACLGEPRLFAAKQKWGGAPRETLRPAGLKTAGVPGPGARRRAPVARIGQSEEKKREVAPLGLEPSGSKKDLAGRCCGHDQARAERRGARPPGEAAGSAPEIWGTRAGLASLQQANRQSSRNTWTGK